MEATFFTTPQAFRAWLEKHHDQAEELWVGFYKKASGKPSITYSEAVDQALCFGWIDGVRKGIDSDSYTNRFTPRRRRSNWSAINVRRVKELQALGLIHPAGLKAFEARADDRTAVYSFEQRASPEFEPAYEKQFRANKKAWDYFQAQAPWYRRTATWWVTSAKKEETRWRRLATLIGDSEQGRSIGPLTRPRNQ